ncbi:hypothetical protein CHARACLAT_013421, partial [Characodon lateralis]|nr:hypothetical protein [Characodon lateralis]
LINHVSAKASNEGIVGEAPEVPSPHCFYSCYNGSVSVQVYSDRAQEEGIC